MLPNIIDSIIDAISHSIVNLLATNKGGFTQREANIKKKDGK